MCCAVCRLAITIWTNFSHCVLEKNCKILLNKQFLKWLFPSSINLISNSCCIYSFPSNWLWHLRSGLIYLFLFFFSTISYGFFAYAAFYYHHFFFTHIPNIQLFSPFLSLIAEWLGRYVWTCGIIPFHRCA